MPSGVVSKIEQLFSKVVWYTLLLNVLPIISFYLLTMREIFSSEVYVAVSFFLLLPYLVSVFKRIVVKHWELICFFVVTVVFCLLNPLFTNYGIGVFFVFVGTFTLAIFLLENPKSALVLVLVYFLYLVGYVSIGVFVRGENIDLLYDKFGLSRNYPGFLFVAAASFWVFVKYRQRAQSSLILPAVAVFFTILLSGRSSFLSAAALLVVCFLFYDCNKWLKYAILCAACAIGLLIITGFDELPLVFGRLSSEGLGSSRYSIWLNYITHQDLVSFLFGIDPTTIPVVADYAGNTHNSFLSAHARMGIFPVLFVCYLIVRALIYYYQNKQPLLFCVLCIYIFRLFFDSCSLSNFDFVLFCMLFAPYFSTDKGAVDMAAS